MFKKIKEFFLEIFTWWNGQTLGTRIHTIIHGRLVGSDLDGNRYYINKKIKIADGLFIMAKLMLLKLTQIGMIGFITGPMRFQL